MSVRPVVGLARGGRYDEQQIKAAIEDGATPSPDARSNLHRLTEWAEKCRLLHNRVCRLLPKAEQDELLELSLALCLAALEQQRSTEETP